MEKNANAIEEECLSLFIRRSLTRILRNEMASLDAAHGGYDSSDDASFGDGAGDDNRPAMHEAVAFWDVSQYTEILMRDRDTLEQDSEAPDVDDVNEKIINISDIQIEAPEKEAVKETTLAPEKINVELLRPTSHSGLHFKTGNSLLNSLLGKGRTSSMHSREPVKPLPSTPQAPSKPEKKARKGMKFWGRKRNEEPKPQQTSNTSEFRPESSNRNSRAEEPTVEARSKLFQFFTRNRHSERNNCDSPQQHVSN